MEERRGINIIAGVNEALKIRKEDPNVSEEKIMQHIMHLLRDKEFKDSKVDVIAGVAYSIKIIQKNPKIKDKEVIKLVMENLNEIVQEKD
jgi:hypothetical protein